MRSCAACRTAVTYKRRANGEALCRTCYEALPPLTADSWARSMITTRQALDCLRLRRVSLARLGGGRHTR